MKRLLALVATTMIALTLLASPASAHTYTYCDHGTHWSHGVEFLRSFNLGHKHYHQILIVKFPFPEMKAIRCYH